MIDIFDVTNALNAFHDRMPGGVRLSPSCSLRAGSRRTLTSPEDGLPSQSEGGKNRGLPDITGLPLVNSRLLSAARRFQGSTEVSPHRKWNGWFIRNVELAMKAGGGHFSDMQRVQLAEAQSYEEFE